MLNLLFRTNFCYLSSHFLPSSSLVCLDDVITDFDQVYQTESRLREAVFSSINTYVSSKVDKWQNNFQLSGSLMEGCFSPSFFMGNGTLNGTNGTLAKEIDVDIERMLARLPATYVKCIVDTKPGFLQLQIMNNGCNFSMKSTSFAENKGNMMDKSGFLLSNKIKDYLLRRSMNNLKHRNHDVETLSRLFQLPLKVLNFFGNVTKSTYLHQYLVAQQEFYLFLSFDIALLIRLEWMSKYTEMDKTKTTLA